MEPVEIGLWVSGGMLIMVLLGMRVAFAAGLAGFVGITWVFWDKFNYASDKFLYWNERREIWDGALGKAMQICLLYTSPSPRDLSTSRMPSSA